MTHPAEVLTFWFGDDVSEDGCAPEKTAMWFTKSERTDELIRQRFEAAVRAAAAGEYSGWAETAEGTLAAIILLDQFSRNIYRGRAESFANDARALDLCLRGLSRQMDRALLPVQRVFLYLPLEHAEDLTCQDRSVALFTKLRIEAPPGFRQMADSYLDYAERHRTVIRRFGRYPHRNQILGRLSTPEESEWLKQPGSSF